MKSIRFIPLVLLFSLAVIPSRADTLLISNTSPVRVTVPVDDALGLNWTGAVFDDSSWVSGTNGVGYETNAGGYAGNILADSAADWSVAGLQGENYWLNGYFDRTNDEDGIYDADEFVWINDEWYWRGISWELGAGGNPAANPPWVRISEVDIHPNGINNGFEGWSMRRWISTHTGDATVLFHLRKANGANQGVTGKVFHNGVEIFTQAVPGNDTVGFNELIAVTLADGDILDFAQTPIGPSGDTSDGSDSSVMTARVISGTATNTTPGLAGRINTDLQTEMMGSNATAYVRIPFDVADPNAIDTLRLYLQWNDGFLAYLNGNLISEQNAAKDLSGLVVADSLVDWSSSSTNVVNGWEYGYYNLTQDGDSIYQRVDFTSFPTDGSATASSNNYWNGTIYDWFNGNPPWTQLGQEAAHPNGANNGNEHQVVRRWNATVDANLSARFRVSKQNTSCGDGVIGVVYHNNVEVFRQAVAFNDGVGFDVEVLLPDVFIGDTIDFMVAPGAGDSCDSAFFSAQVFEGQAITPWNGNAIFARSVEETLTGSVIDLTPEIVNLNVGTNLLAIHGLNVTSNDANFFVRAELRANQFPEQGTDTYSVMQPNTTNLSFAALLATDSDAEGDVLVLQEVSRTTSLGGSVAIISNELVYTPPAPITVTGTDTFTYLFADGSGVSITGQVEVVLTADLVSPSVIAATVLPSLNQIRIVYSEEMNALTATNSINYSLSPADRLVNSVTTSLDLRSVVLTLDQVLPTNTTYEVTISGVTDVSGNVIDPEPSTVSVSADVLPCFARAEFWFGVGGSVLSNLTNLATYPDAPNEVRFLPSLETRSGQGNNYGVKVSGWLRAPTNGAYHFALSSDDNGGFWLSTNASPDNLVLLCSEPVWNGPRNWLGTDRRNPVAPENLSSTIFSNGIDLVASELYYFEALMKQGGGGNNLGVTWQIPGEPAISAANLPISSDYLFALDEDLGPEITITQQPLAARIFLPDPAPMASYAVTADGNYTNSPLVATLAYQWQRNDGGGWTDLPDQAASNLSLNVSGADGGAQFRARIALPGLKVFSDPASLIVATRVIDGIAASSGDSYTITIQAVVGLSYELQRALDANNPTWVTVDTQAGAGGSLDLVDPAPPEVRAYYRVVIP